MTKKIPLNRAWEFAERFDEAFMRGEPGDDVVPAELPHTCRLTPYHYFDESLYQMVCGYRRRLTVPEDWAGQRVFLTLEAAGHSAEVFVNGEKLGEHHCGYTAFRTELTAALTPGETALIAVRVDSRESQDIPPFGFVIDYMTFGGLYREAWLEVRPPVFIDDVFVKPEYDPVSREGVLRSEIALSGPVPAGEYMLRQTVSPWGLPALTTARDIVPTREDMAFTELGCGPVDAWDIDEPVFYEVRTELLREREVVDAATVRAGFRRAEFRADGFYLNGRRVKLTGLNRHQSYPSIGYAAPKALQRADADILKRELGVNAVRTSHYPQSRHFIDRCDELGLLVFTEIPGWQHIGGEAWQEQAVQNTADMVRQYRNHPSVILWGVRINESVDNDALYVRTNAAARQLDSTRPTSGVRYLKKSSFLEDVYAYNDFSHDGSTPGCEKKRAVTSDMRRAYLISEHNGHMFPTKPFDDEEHRLSHALRHAAVLDAAAAEEDIAGAFGWCMFDYNTHRDFGSGDRVCYHGVTDMFRNKKLAAAVYAVRQDETPVLEVSSAMDIGEHPGGNLGRLFVFTNADAVRFYKNGVFIREYTHADSPYKSLSRAPIEIDDFVGDQVERGEDFQPKQAALVKDILNHTARFGSTRLPPRIMCKAAWLMLRYRMTFADAYALFQKYIGSWGGEAVEYRFEAVKDGAVVKTVIKTPMTALALTAEADHTALSDAETYDAALVRLRMTDQNGNTTPYWGGPVTVETEGPVAVYGAAPVLRGGTGGFFLRTTGGAGPAAVTLRADGLSAPVRVEFTVTKRDIGEV